jgi:hypothetical protein
MKRTIKNYRSRSFLVKFFIVPAAIVIFGSAVDVSAQCQNLTYDKSLFNAVSADYRENLLKRFDEFLKIKCEENLEALYEMMPSFFREANPKETFIRNMQFYYKGKNRFVSFIPQAVAESIDLQDNKADLWHIDGCLTEVINGKRRSFIKILEAQREKDEIVFLYMTTQPNSLGYNDKKCKP